MEKYEEEEVSGGELFIEVIEKVEEEASGSGEDSGEILIGILIKMQYSMRRMSRRRPPERILVYVFWSRIIKNNKSNNVFLWFLVQNHQK